MSQLPTEFHRFPLFFYKGTAFPQVVDAPNLEAEMMKNATEMIVLGLKHGVSMEQQKKDYKEQLDLMEQRLCDEARNKIMDEGVIDRAMVSLGIESRDYFYSTWCLNICALLKMKVIKDDNENGILSADKMFWREAK